MLIVIDPIVHFPAILQKAQEEERDWASHVCSNPRTISHDFEGARTLEGFAVKNLDNPSIPEFDLEIPKELWGSIDPNNVALLVIYPSTAIRSVYCDISTSEKTIHVKILDPLVFIDPDEDRDLPINGNVSSFRAQITVFAVN